MYKFLVPTFVLIVSAFLFLPAVKAAEFVGSKICSECHQSTTRDWEKSDHFKSMAPANSQNVLGDFDDVSVEFHGIKTRFYVKGAQYWISTVNEQGKLQSYPIQFTFGHYPLQQYLVETNGGRLQAFNIAWDSRPQKEGGQRWFHLQPEESITPEHPFFWTRHFQNWNSRCADCHSTNVDKGYSSESNQYKTSFSEVNVGCEACHGPGSKHLEIAKLGKLSAANNGFSSGIIRKGKWTFKNNSKIASKIYKAPGHQESLVLDNCGGCHSRRANLTKIRHGADFHDQFQLQSLREGLYHVDGQIQDEVFVMGSFLQSKMFQKGVTCLDCHNAHSGKLLVEGNGLCLQCHQATEYATKEHHKHPLESVGGQCVSCHMPETVYMGVDARRDHSFRVPAPALANHLSTPNTCENCHAKKSITLNDVEEQVSPSTLNTMSAWAKVNHNVRRGDPLSVRQVEKLGNDESLPDIRYATLLEQLSAVPSKVSVQIAAKQFKSNNPILRRAAVASMENTPVEIKSRLLAPLIDDPAHSVRMEVARVLAVNYRQLPQALLNKTIGLFKEYRESLAYNVDSPSGLSALANFEIAIGNYTQVEGLYLSALKIEPSYVPAMINLADLYRAQNKELESGRLLKKAVVIASESAMPHHALGLHYVRLQQYQAALGHLAKATQLDGALPRYSFVYAVALDNQGQKTKAIEVLERAVVKWPNQYDLLITLVNLMEQDGRLNEAGTYISQLSKLAPSAPQVLDIIKKFKSS